MSLILTISMLLAAFTKSVADMNDIINIMQKCGAYNVANLDGGTSSAMVENGQIINAPIDSRGKHQTRPISTAFIVKE